MLRLHRPGVGEIRWHSSQGGKPLTRPRILWIAAGAVAVLAVVLLWTVPHVQPQTGTLIVVASGRSAGTLPSSTLMLHQTGGAWETVGSVSGYVPAAPDVRQLIALAVPARSYDSVRVGIDSNEVSIRVTQGQVEPLLVGVDAGRMIGGAAYAGNDEVNLGRGELAGKFVSLQPFDLVDQAGRPLTNASTAGRDVVIAAFHTTCHETCPLYTALFLQLAKRLPPTVMLVEVTTDPSVDTPDMLAGYSRQVGASWTFATGTSDQVGGFWKQFAVELSGGDAHTSSMVLVDRHGYVRLVYRGVPKVGTDVPPALTTTLSAQGLRELASGGDGWGAPDVLSALVTIAGSNPTSQTNGGKAPNFTLTSTDGGTVALASLAGKPLVINFWRSDCPPCRAEMPLLQQAAAQWSGVRLVLINWGESADTARTYLARLGIHRAALLDSDLAVGRAYGVAALPTTVFVRSDGTIDRRQIGQLDDRVLAAELSNLSTQ